MEVLQHFQSKSIFKSIVNLNFKFPIEKILMVIHLINLNCIILIFCSFVHKNINLKIVLNYNSNITVCKKKFVIKLYAKEIQIFLRFTC